MIIDILLIFFGFFLLVKGADILVDGSSSLANNYKVSKMVIGLTIVAFGTNVPELAIAFKSIITNNPDIIIGNVFASNIMNILLILGIGSIITPLSIKNNTVSKEIPLALLFSTMLVVLLLDGPINGASLNEISRSDGIIALLFFAVFIYYIVAESKKVSRNKETENPKYTIRKSIVYVIIGLIIIVAGSNIVVDYAAKIAVNLGIPSKIIAMTIVALGTGMPEIITTIVSSKKGEQDILIGNLIGSNVFNICVAIGLPVAIFGGIQTENFNYFDIFVFITSSIILYYFAKKDHKISRLEGVILVTLFIIYYTILLITGL